MIVDLLAQLGVKPMQILIQIVGFLLVFGLLGKLLWKPLLNLMDEREKEVKDMYAKAEEASQKADRLEADFQKRLADINAETQRKLLESEDRVEAQAEKIIADAHAHAEEVISKAQNAARDEFTKAKSELRDFAANLSIDIAEKVLGDQVDKDKHEALVKQFLSDMESMN